MTQELDRELGLAHDRVYDEGVDGPPDQDLVLGVGRTLEPRPRRRGGPGRRTALGGLVLAVVIGMVVAIAGGVVAVSAHHFLRKMTPQQFYAAHHGQFTHLAGELRSGDLVVSRDTYGSALPTRYRDLSVDGSVSRLAADRGKVGYFVPRWIGTPEDAGGFVLAGDLPRSEPVDLNGAIACLAGGVDLGDGWYYLEPGHEAACDPA